jgi:hypothetical protein
MSNGLFGRATAVPLVTTAVTALVNVAGPGTGFTVNSDRNAGLTVNNGPQVLIEGMLNITPGTTTSSANISCVDEAGTAIDLTQNVPATAAVPNTFAFEFVDTRGDNRPHTYTVRIAQVAATTNGTVNLIIAQASTPG